jgi:Flp pilus assembly protein TadG
MRMRLPRFRRGRAKSIGQSLVEFTVLLPVLLIMISGLIEFGIMLNYYLDLIDAAREAARWASDADPIRDPNDGSYMDPNPLFYTNVQTLTKEALLAASDGRIDWIDNPLDATDDDDDDCSITINGTNDIVISAFGIRNNSGSPVVDKRFPVAAGENGVSLCNNKFSKFTSAEIQARLDPNAPTSGLVMVEIFYDYHQILALPWITAFVPNPIQLHAYTIMPNAYVEPTPTP